MNDFTKEELQDLWCYIREFMGNGYDHPKGHKGYIMMRKIQSMIDNYCEHESNIMSTDERERKFKIYREQILPEYENDPDKVPPHLEPDFNEGWK